MRKAFLPLALLILAAHLDGATAKPELALPCWAPVIAPAEIFAEPFETIVLGGARPLTMCAYQFATSTPDVMTIESVKFTETTFEIRVKTLAPGEGVVTVTSRAVGGGTYTVPVSKIHVDSCAEAAHAVKLPAAFSVATPVTVHIAPEITGFFQHGFYWSVNGGVPVSTGPTFDFLPPGYGTFTITVHAETATCGSVDTTTRVTVGPTRLRSVRRR
jgi:hypothetical protein